MCFTYLTWTLFTIAFPNFTFQYFQGRFIFSVFRSLTEVLCRWLLQLFHLHSIDADNFSLMWSTFSLSWWRTTGKLVYFLCWTFSFPDVLLFSLFIARMSWKELLRFLWINLRASLWNFCSKTWTKHDHHHHHHH